VKRFNFAIFVLVIAALSPSSAYAQLGANSGMEFVEAVRNSDGNKADELLHGHPGIVDARGGDGNTGLMVAVQRRDDQWTGFLLNQGADPNLPGANGDTPLIAASRIGFDTAVEWLLEVGAKVDGTNKMGETALIAAVQQRQVPVVKLLLNAGADPDKRDSAQGFSAREYAARDPRARDILQLINNKKPKVSAAR
jgi:ankyrin repeat protein